MIKNLEAIDIQRYADIAEKKSPPTNTLMVDVTGMLPVFKASVNLHHPELGDGEVFTLFKIGIEVHFIIYCLNNGYIDEHYMDVLTEEIGHLDTGLNREDAEVFPAIHAGDYNQAFYYIHDFIPSNIEKKNLLPVRWDTFGDRLKLIVNEYPNLIETLFEEI